MRSPAAGIEPWSLIHQTMKKTYESLPKNNIMYKQIFKVFGEDLQVSQSKTKAYTMIRNIERSNGEIDLNMTSLKTFPTV